MISEELKRLVKKQELALRGIWVAFLAAVLLFCITGKIVMGDAAASHLQPEMFVYICYLAAITLTFGSLVVPRLMLSDRKLKAKLAVRHTPKEAAIKDRTGQVVQEELEKLERLTPVELELYLIANSYMVPLLISLVLAEAITIIGLVAAVSRLNFNSMMPFVGVTVVLYILFFPRLTPFLERAERLAGQLTN